MRISKCSIYTLFQRRKKTLLRCNKRILTFLCLLFFLCAGELEVKAAETDWTYQYTGAAQQFTAPYTGKYQFDLYGAQGTAYGAYTGGKGGRVTVTLSLSRGDTVEIYVGGQNGYNGGGTGTVSKGGGATDIRINGNRKAIAGGGGGATAVQGGGAGGCGGNNGVSFSGSSSTVTGSAGGGGGYYGGTAGRYKAGHIHTTDCYSTEVCGAGWEHIYYGPDDNDTSNDRYTCYNGHCHAESHGGRCPTEITTLTCTQSTATINTISYGGSNWYDTASCTLETNQSGVQSGNGVCNIRILSLYNLFYQDTESLNVYYDGQTVKNVYYDGTLIYQQ